MPADRHEFSLPERRQSRRSDVRLHHRAVRPDEWIVLHGMPVTRPSRIAADMLDDKEDPEAVAQVIVDALRPADDYPGTFADALAPYAVSFTLRRGDGLALLRWLLDTAGDPEMSRWIQEARAHLEQFRREGRGVASCSPRRSDASMTGGRSYANPGAFRRALTDKLRVLASQSHWTLQQLQRQMAYDRLLERLYLVDEGWIIKGATALLARDIGVRGTIDIDLYRQVAREIAEADLRRAAALEIGDWFRFEIGPPRPLAGTGGARLPVKAFVWNTEWAAFHVDLVGKDLRMTSDPEYVPPLARVVMPDVEQHGYRAYPLVDHVADRVCAIFERHGSAGAPSTRYSDLADLVAIVLAASAEAEMQLAALRSEAQRRGLQLPGRFAVPDRVGLDYSTWPVFRAE